VAAQSTRLHVTFGHSAAHSLKLALARLNCSEEVALLPEDFSIGPIDPGDAAQRAQWEDEELDEAEPTATSASVSTFWEKVSSWPGIIVVWMSSRSVVELCGFHVLLWRLPRANIQAIDVSTVEFRSPKYDERQAFAIVRDDRIVEHGLLDVATPVTDVARASSRNKWQQLRQENAPLRILTEKGLTSVPVDYFDDRIRERITDSWQSCSRVVGDVMGTFWSGPLLEFHSPAFVFVRLLRLLDTNEFEGQTDEEQWSIRTSQVRRRPR